MAQGAPEPSDRAEALLKLAQKAANDLVEGLAVLCLLAAPQAEASRTLAREKARHLFLFVLLSVLLEGRPGQDPEDRDVAEALKAAFARQLVEDRRQAAQLLSKALKPGREELLRRKLAAAEPDPFAPYYDSFKKAASDPDNGPFAILARMLAKDHFETRERSAAYQRIYTLSVVLSDQLVEGLVK
jgi:hypothetical protein